MGGCASGHGAAIAGGVCGVPSGSPGFASPRCVMLCHGRHDRSAWAVGLSGMARPLRAGCAVFRPVLPALRLPEVSCFVMVGIIGAHGRLSFRAWSGHCGQGLRQSVRFPRLCVFGTGSLPSIRFRSIPPAAASPAQRNPFSRVSRARAIRAFRAGARFARLIAPARARGQGARRTPPLRFPGFFFRAGAKREAKRSADAACLPLRHPIMDWGRSSLFGKYFWNFGRAACCRRGEGAGAAQRAH